MTLDDIGPLGVPMLVAAVVAAFVGFGMVFALLFAKPSPYQAAVAPRYRRGRR